MLLKIYEFITKLQKDIGNGAEIRLYAREGFFEIRVDWLNDNFYAQYLFTEIELAQVVDDSLPVNYFVAWFKNEYAHKVKAAEQTDGLSLLCPIHRQPGRGLR